MMQSEGSFAQGDSHDPAPLRAELDARVDPRGRDEIARLAASVNTMADALGARLEAERRVTADIAHELRTPVAGMSTAAGLLPPGPATELIRRSVQNLRGLVEDVLEVARMDAQVVAPETEERQVSAMARRAVAGLDQVEVRVSADAVVTTDPRRVERILANLASNVTTESTMLGMENYNDLARRGNVALNAVGISTSSLEQSVRDLATGGSNRAMTQSTARALLRLIIAVSEGTRFRPLATQVAGAINNGGTFTTGDRYVVLIRDWDGISTVYRDHLDNPSSTTGHTVQGWGSVNSVATAAALLLAAMGAGSMSFPKTEL